MERRFKTIAAILSALGLICLAASAVALYRTQQGMDALQKFSAAQNVVLSYDDDGNLTDRGTTEGADAILSLVEDDWGYPIAGRQLDPDDPLVNTASEYMYQMGTIVHHVLEGTQTVVLEEDVEYEGETFTAGTYEVDVDGRYWTDFDRMHPLEGPAREQAWTGTVHGLVGELGVGVVTHTSIQVGYATGGILAAIGLLSLLTGWALYGLGSTTTDPVAADRQDNDDDPKADDPKTAAGASDGEVLVDA